MRKTKNVCKCKERERGWTEAQYKIPRDLKDADKEDKTTQN
jgi:hypothetical protein